MEHELNETVAENASEVIPAPALTSATMQTPFPDVPFSWLVVGGVVLAVGVVLLILNREKLLAWWRNKDVDAGGMPDGHRPCHRCSFCRTCKGTGRVKGKDCGACLACAKCDGTRFVPYERPPSEDAFVILTRQAVMKRPMLEHLALFLGEQAEGDVVLERLLKKRRFQLQDGSFVAIDVRRLTEKDNDLRTYKVNIEQEAELPPEVPEEMPA